MRKSSVKIMLIWIFDQLIPLVCNTAYPTVWDLDACGQAWEHARSLDSINVMPAM